MMQAVEYSDIKGGISSTDVFNIPQECNTVLFPTQHVSNVFISLECNYPVYTTYIFVTLFSKSCNMYVWMDGRTDGGREQRRGGIYGDMVKLMYNILYINLKFFSAFTFSIMANFLSQESLTENKRRVFSLYMQV